MFVLTLMSRWPEEKAACFAAHAQWSELSVLRLLARADRPHYKMKRLSPWVAIFKILVKEIFKNYSGVEVIVLNNV